MYLTATAAEMCERGNVTRASSGRVTVFLGARCSIRQTIHNGDGESRIASTEQKHTAHELDIVSLDPVTHLLYSVPSVLYLALVLPGSWLVKVRSSNLAVLPQRPHENCLVHRASAA